MNNTILADSREAGMKNLDPDRISPLVEAVCQLVATVDTDFAAYVAAYPQGGYPGTRKAALQPTSEDDLPTWQEWIDSLPAGSQWQANSTGVWTKRADGMWPPDEVRFGALAVSAHYVRNSAPYMRVTS